MAGDPDRDGGQEGRRGVLDMIKKTMMTGIGIALKTRDEVEELATELIQKGKMSEKEGQKLLNDILQRYEESKHKLETRVEGIVKNLLKKADIVTGDDLKGLKKEIRELKKAISKGPEAGQ